MTTDERWTAETIERVAREITHGWMAHLGYTSERITELDYNDPHIRAGCDFDSDSGWCCVDEDGKSLHPEYDESCEVAELVMFVLEHPALASHLLPPGFTPEAEREYMGPRAQRAPYGAANSSSG